MSGICDVIGSGAMGAAMLGSALVGLALLVSLAVGVVAAIRWMARGTPGSARPAAADRALQLARERYARGEIGREEFQRLLEDLG